MQRSPVLALLGAAFLALPACDSDGPGGPLGRALANPGEWTWVSVEGAQCRNGSATGIGVRLQEGTDDLVIYLEGGGACFNEETCGRTLPSFGEDEFDAWADQFGKIALFNTSNTDNPTAYWNAVYVPYCTGDVHSGSFPNNTLIDQQLGTDLGPQQFVGHQNMKLALALLQAELDTPRNVLLSGSSAGGLGALLNFGEMADTFSDSGLFLLNDSGPLFFADNVLSPQLLDQISQLYNISAVLPDAPELFQPDALPNIYAYYGTTYPNASLGLASHLGDNVFQTYYAYGQPPGDRVTDSEYAAGLRDVRERLTDNWGTYFAPGGDHTFLHEPTRYFGSFGGPTLAEWLGDLLAGNPTDVDPDDLPGLGGARGREL